MLPNLSACSYVKSWFPDKTRDYLDTGSLPPLKIPVDLGGDYYTDSPNPESSPLSVDKAIVKNQDVAQSPPPSEKSTGSNPATTVENQAVVQPPPLSEKSTGNNPSAAVENQAVVQSVPPAEKVAVNNSPAAAGENQDAAQSVTEQTNINPKSISVELIKEKSGVNTLQFDALLITSWRMVNKALGHQSIEVTDRNPAEGEFTIQYDPNEKKLQDESFLDEMIFMFKGVQGNEKTYHLKLVETSQHTNVFVLDKDKHPASNDLSLKLLTDLQKNIKSSSTP